MSKNHPRSKKIQAFLAMYPIVFVLSVLIFCYVSYISLQPADHSIPFIQEAGTVALILGLFVVLEAVFYRILRDLTKAALMTFVVGVFFIYYAEFVRLPYQLKNLGVDYALLVHLVEERSGRWVSFGVWVGLNAGLIIAIVRWKRIPQAMTNWLAAFTVISLGASIYSWIDTPIFPTGECPSAGGLEDCAAYWTETLDETETTTVAATSETLPDIYYIVLDGMGRADVLSQYYGLDGDVIPDELRELGFYVADQSTSNYIKTALCLASTLNMEYVNPVAEQMEPSDMNLWPMTNLIEESYALAYLRQKGYQIVTFPSGFVHTEIAGADEVMEPEVRLDDYQTILFKSSALAQIFYPLTYDLPRERITWTLANLPQAAQIEGPKFVFAHILAPHPPFVLGSDGEAKYPDMIYIIRDGRDYTVVEGLEEYTEGYKEQVEYLEKALPAMIEGILANSETEPVIIIQGDHGPRSQLAAGTEQPDAALKETMSILNAYYLPGQDYERLYPSITPVNSLRVVFDQVFSEDFGLVEDLNYYAPLNAPYGLEDVTERVDK